MKLSEALEKYADWEIDEEKLKEFAKPPVKSGRWKPKEDERYYQILWDGRVDRDINIMDIDKRAISIGNCFQTKSEAERAVECLKIRAELLDNGGRSEFKMGVDNYHLVYSHAVNRFTVHLWKNSRMNPFEVYFDSEEAAQAAIEKVGKERLLKYWFGVESEENNND